MVKDFEIYSRWGEKVFQVGNVPANDPQHGWNGTVKGTPAPTGTYVYMVTVALPGGTRQFFKGTIVLIR
jgi:gliding motility-associated-like protein